MLAVPVLPTSLGGSVIDVHAVDVPGTSVSYTAAPLGDPLDVVGIPRVTVRVKAPTFAAGADPAVRLALFAKLYDVAPDGSARIIRNQISAARIVDPAAPVTIELPGLVHRFPAGHRLRLTLSTSAATFRSTLGGGPVSIVTDAADPGVLEIPRLRAQTGAVGSGPNGLTPFGVTAVKAQAAAKLRRARCASKRRVVRFRLRGAKRLTVARVRINGRLAKTVRGKRLRKPVKVRVPRRGGRVVVTSRTKRGAVRRSARRYRACKANRVS
jgi:hypothetical protein